MIRLTQPPLQTGELIRLPHFPRNLARDFGQYTCERLERTSQNEKSKKPKTRKGSKLIKYKNRKKVAEGKNVTLIARRIILEQEMGKRPNDPFVILLNGTY